MTSQLQLLPSAPPETRRATLALEELRDFEHAQPRQQLIESIRRLGVLQPILAAGDACGGYRLIDGRRRVKAIQLLHERDQLPGPAEIEAEIIEACDPYTDPAHAGLTLTLHGTRSASPICELQAIEEILRHGEDENETVTRIAQATGMAVGTIRRRLKLRNLSPTLRDSFEHGELTVTVAEAASKLGEHQQHEFEQLLDSGRRITLANVQEIARWRTAEAAATLDHELFQDHNTMSWRATVRGHLNAALEALPATEQGRELAEAIKDALRRAETVDTLPVRAEGEGAFTR